MKFGTFHGVEDSGLLGCDPVLKVVPSISKDCGTVILTLEVGGTMIRNSLPNDILCCHPRRLQSVATPLRSHFPWIVVQGMFIGFTIFLCDVPF